jgi:hypothetical protein
MRVAPSELLEHNVVEFGDGEAGGRLIDTTHSAHNQFGDLRQRRGVA